MPTNSFYWLHTQQCMYIRNCHLSIYDSRAHDIPQTLAFITEHDGITTAPAAANERTIVAHNLSYTMTTIMKFPLRFFLASTFYYLWNLCIFYVTITNQTCYRQFIGFHPFCSGGKHEFRIAPERALHERSKKNVQHENAASPFIFSKW